MDLVIDFHFGTGGSNGIDRANQRAFTAADTFVRVDDEGVAVGFGFGHVNGVVTAHLDAFLAKIAFGLVDGIQRAGLLAAVDAQHDEQGQYKKDAGESFHAASDLKGETHFHFTP
jgi:hypothetical protein